LGSSSRPPKEPKDPSALDELLCPFCDWRAKTGGREVGHLAVSSSIQSRVGQLKEDLVKSLVVYESMYGNTHRIATAIAEGLSEAGETVLMPLYQVVEGSVRGVDLLVVGGPTHAHGVSRASTRKAAAEAAHDAEKHLTLEAQGAGRGLRDWFRDVGDLPTRGAAFDTRVDLPSVVTGRASTGIARRLRHHKCHQVTKPESFLVDKTNHLLPGEEDRARQWGVELVKRLGSGDLASAI
jgi:hypothetical protein